MVYLINIKVVNLSDSVVNTVWVGSHRLGGVFAKYLRGLAWPITTCFLKVIPPLK